tara:strand:- start:502 stop:1224 length:723 start_codon:yes stop_codon:yes gene_type:complete
MCFILFFILYCNIDINSLLFSHNNFSYNKISRINNNIILKSKYNNDLINPKYTLIYDNNMPIIYSKINLHNIQLKKAVYSLEHIYPISHMTDSAKIDMHNLFKTTKFLNNARSNYKYTDYVEFIIYPNNTYFTIKNDVINNDNWITLENDNYVNHKKKLFIPSNESKGIISRAILYTTFKYKFEFEKVINLDTLISWYLKYPPTDKEKYHNNYVKKIQYTDNKFISSYKSNIRMLLKLKK